MPTALLKDKFLSRYPVFIVYGVYITSVALVGLTVHNG